MEELPYLLRKKIVDFLMTVPSLHDGDSQRALIVYAGIDLQLQAQIPIGYPPRQFVPLFISVANKYGKLDDGRDPIESILEAKVKLAGKVNVDDISFKRVEFTSASTVNS